MTKSFFDRWAGALGGFSMLLLLIGLWYGLFGREDHEARDIRGRTPIIVAAEEGDAVRVRQLLTKGVQVDAVDDCRWTAMMRAAASGHADIVITLLEHGAAIDHREKSGYTAVMAAVINNHPDMLAALLRRGADVNVQETEGGNSALMWAAKDGNAAMLQMLLEAGADPALRNKAGETARDLSDQRLAQ